MKPWKTVDGRVRRRHKIIKRALHGAMNITACRLVGLPLMSTHGFDAGKRGKFWGVHHWSMTDCKACLRAREQQASPVSGGKEEEKEK